MKEIIDYSKEEIGTQIGEYKIEHCQTCGRNGLHISVLLVDKYIHTGFKGTINDEIWSKEYCHLRLGKWKSFNLDPPTLEQEIEYDNILKSEKGH